MFMVAVFSYSTISVHDGIIPVTSSDDKGSKDPVFLWYRVYPNYVWERFWNSSPCIIRGSQHACMTSYAGITDIGATKDYIENITAFLQRPVLHIIKGFKQVFQSCIKCRGIHFLLLYKRR